MSIPQETVPSSIASAASPEGGGQAADSGLRCPVCEYNLTGVIEDRCPECGEAFDREQLLAILAEAPEPIPIWDDHNRNIVWRFACMCLLAWFRPIHLSRMLPKNHSAASATRFRWLVLAASMLPAGAAAIGIDLRVGLAVIAACVLPILVGIVIVEASLAADVCDMVHSPTAGGDGERPTSVAWWLGFLGFLRSFMLLETLVLAFVVWCSPPLEMGWAFIIALIPLLWWWLNVLAVVSVQPVANSAKLRLILLSPMYLGMAVLVAGILGYLEVGIVRIVASSLR